MQHRSQLLLDQLDIYQRAGQWQSALVLCKHLYDEGWKSHSPENLLEAVLKTGFVFSARGDRELAIEHFVLAELIGRLIGDESRVARALNGLGVVHQAMGRVDESLGYYHSALEAANEARDRLTAGDVEMNVGILANIRGDLDEALRHYEQARMAYEEIASRNRLAKVLNNLGMLWIDMREFAKAAEALERAINIARSLADVATEGIVQSNRAELFIMTQEFENARMCCDQAFEIASELGDDALKTDVLKYYGILFRELGKPHLAESHLEQAISLAQAIGNPLLEAEATRELSLVLRAENRNREALESLNRCHRLFSDLRAKHDAAEITGRLEQLEADFLALVAQWGESIEAKDRYTSGHCSRVADYGCHIAKVIGMTEADLKWFRMGAFLHDVGKVEVPEEILNKPGRLSDEERAIMERHTIIGDSILASLEFPWDIRPIVRSHHERWDGKGYPDGLLGEAIPVTARILKIVDVFDALTTTRSYRNPLSPHEAVALMDEDPDAFDPALFELFKAELETMLKIIADSDQSMATV